MACTSITLNGIALDCSNIGGLKVVYIADVADVTTVTVVAGIVTAISMTPGKTFKTFSFRKGNANFVATGTRNDANGTSFVSTVLTATFNKMETAKRAEMQALMAGNTYIIALDNNGKYWLLDYDSYSTGVVVGNSGSAMGDANNYQLTMTTETNELPMEVDSGVISAIIA